MQAAVTSKAKYAKNVFLMDQLGEKLSWENSFKLNLSIEVNTWTLTLYLVTIKAKNSWFH